MLPISLIPPGAVLLPAHREPGPCQGTQLSPLPKPIAGVSPKAGLSRLHPGWKTGPQLSPCCQGKGRKRRAGRAGQSRAGSLRFRAKRGGGAAPAGEKGPKRLIPGCSDPLQAQGKAGGRRAHPGQTGCGKHQRTPTLAIPTASCDLPGAPRPPARYLQGRPSTGIRSRSPEPAPDPAPDLLYRSSGWGTGTNPLPRRGTDAREGCARERCPAATTAQRSSRGHANPSHLPGVHFPEIIDPGRNPHPPPAPLQAGR